MREDIKNPAFDGDFVLLIRQGSGVDFLSKDGLKTEHSSFSKRSAMIMIVMFPLFDGAFFYPCSGLSDGCVLSPGFVGCVPVLYAPVDLVRHPAAGG